MKIHEEKHPLADQKVKIKLAAPFSLAEASWTDEDPEYLIEDWYDRVAGQSWMFSNGNLAALNYAVRSVHGDLPLDDNVVYGKIHGLGYILHQSEIIGDDDDSA